jgi:hypothetical protein
MHHQDKPADAGTERRDREPSGNQSQIPAHAAKLATVIDPGTIIPDDRSGMTVTAGGSPQAADPPRWP